MTAAGLLASAAVVTLLVALWQRFAQRELVVTHRELERAHTELAALATTDPVTLLPNHRALASSINQEIARSQRLEGSCAVVFLDVDHFKALNDNFGHAAGDTALREIGSIAQRRRRGHSAGRPHHRGRRRLQRDDHQAPLQRRHRPRGGHGRTRALQRNAVRPSRGFRGSRAAALRSRFTRLGDAGVGDARRCSSGRTEFRPPSDRRFFQAAEEYTWR